MPPLLQPPLPSAATPRLRWHQLYGSAAALALAEATRADRRLYVIVVDAARELERLTAELRFFAGADLPLLRLPDWEVLPYDLFSPLPDITSERLKTLYDLPAARRGCLIVTADTLMQRLPPRQYVQGRAFDLAKGQSLALEPFRQRLSEAGYASVSQVVSPGEFAVRGSLLDVFPMGSSAPLRIDLFDDEIEAIRRFDPETQRSLDALDTVRLLPAREVPLDADAVREFRRRWRTRFEGDPTKTTIYRGVSEGLAPAGVEFYQPLFFDTTATLFDYLPRDAVIVHDAALAQTLHKSWQDIGARYEDRRHDLERPVLAPAELFLDPEQLAAGFAAFSSVTLDAFKADTELAGPSPAVHNFPTTAPRELRLDVRAGEPFAPLDEFLRAFEGRVLLAADSGGRREVLSEMLRAHHHAVQLVPSWSAFLAAEARLALTVAPDIEGLTLTTVPPIAVISEAQLFGPRARQERRRKRAVDPEAILRDLQDLNPGAPVVHEEYGVGRYQGLMPMEVGGQPGEFLVLEYQDGDRIYVPVQALHLVSRYTGAAPEHAPLHKLGTDQWARARRRAADQIRDVAAELLDLYARRKAQQGLALAGHRARLPGLRQRLSVRGNRRPGTGDPPGAGGSGSRAAHGPHRVRRRRLRQDRGGDARGLRRHAGRQAGGGARAHDSAGAAAPDQLPRPLRRLAGAHRGAVALRQYARDADGARGARAGYGRHRDRHPSPAARPRALQGPGAADHRRGAPLRRARQAASAGAARQRARAHPDRDPHPAHPQHGARRAARPVAHHHRRPRRGWPSRRS